MQIGLFGLGRMGANMARRWHKEGHDVIVCNRSPAPIDELKGEGLKGVYKIEELVAALERPRAIWVMIPSGKPTDDMIEHLLTILEPGDAIIDSGNSNWHDSKRHYAECKAKGIQFMDQGTSGGVWGLENGYCLMIGGEKETFARLEPAFAALAPDAKYYLHCGAAGAGHFTKMVHNGIEYGMMQAYAEGFEIMKKSEFGLNLRDVAWVWGKGSVVRSWLQELLVNAFEEDGNDLADIRGYVDDSGEGRWTILAGMDEDVPTPVITMALYMRFLSRQQESFAAQVNAALRKQFGGHAVKS
ncbi:MAG TPA: decarboxylating 6-phosphogluconate dehydrogenase [Thermoflexales bacterium]|nr:decarboxylating 6-phosphogluconate dehydrogenase [Thermoflexales bacterium]HQW33857.1 decarboxylating 6-phosphogluconate dehydrogenase [Thermoflexales bacterium]HQX75172.1 decarboxylating 6-phosphogluconate dehydrogenase [Thermoflexales bacterium]HQZ21004.1 decarboxylating 6-phosphogluconate dehydrogenase [Thermoflexales bacterium]HQZ99494.1 decarboxylating 6-phosphogluconate dehydrogenase [Thermoflexales bacterium]